MGKHYQYDPFSILPRHNNNNSLEHIIHTIIDVISLSKLVNDRRREIFVIKVNFAVI